MTLMELLVALVVLSLTTALAYAQIGPWIAHARASADEARFQRALAPAALLLSELAVGAVNPDLIRLDASEVRFTALAPRLSPAPMEVSLAITRAHDSSRLVLRSPALPEESVLLETRAPLRFDVDTDNAIIVEIEDRGAWRPLIFSRLAANAPFVCAFDPIPRTCR